MKQFRVGDPVRNPTSTRHRGVGLVTEVRETDGEPTTRNIVVKWDSEDDGLLYSPVELEKAGPDIAAILKYKAQGDPFGVGLDPESWAVFIELRKKDKRLTAEDYFHVLDSLCLARRTSGWVAEHDRPWLAVLEDAYVALSEEDQERVEAESWRGWPEIVDRVKGGERR